MIISLTALWALDVIGPRASWSHPEVKVFISWSGETSRALAVELRRELPKFVHQVDAWISKRDIAPGQRWAMVLGHELEQSDFAVICLTAENRQSSWILFEAGAVARSLKAQVVPLLFGIGPSDLEGPLAQFQSVQADEVGIKSLVSTLYEACESKLDAEQQDQLFKALWPSFSERLRALAVQVQRNEHVESPIDLMNDLVSAPSIREPTIEEKRNTLDRLHEERERLHRELGRLNAKEEELTRQGAPISLFERAIQPTELQLWQTDLAIGGLLDRTFKQLTPSQLNFLRQLAQADVRADGLRVYLPLDNQIYADIEKLRALGLVAVSENGAVITHDLVAAYIRDKSQPAVPLWERFQS